MNDSLHYPSSLSVTLVSRNRKEWGPRSPLQLWKNQEVLILRSPTWSGCWVESHAGRPFHDDLQTRIRHPHKGSG